MIILKNKEQLDEVMTAVMDRRDMLLDKLDNTFNNKKEKKLNIQLKNIEIALKILEKMHQEKIKIWYK